MPLDPVSTLRFDVAFSFPGEHRSFVAEVADLLVPTFSQERILYDKFHDAEFAMPDLDVHLPGLYRTNSELIVVFLCPAYVSKRWCRLEWRHIRQLIATVDAKKIMFLSFGDPGDLSGIGVLGGDGYIDILDLSAPAVVDKILKRFRLGQGTPPPTPTPLAVSFKPFPDNTITLDRKGFVNCTPAFETFERMLAHPTSVRVLLVHGEGKQGKSTLLNILYNHTRTLIGSKSTARVEFKQPASPPEEHVAALARALGLSPPRSGNIIQQIDSLLDACAGRPVVLFFDAFEHAEHQHSHWVGRVLERCLDDDILRCVVAGREYPPWQSQPWSHLCVSVECDALRDKDALVSHAVENGYMGQPEEIAVMVTAFVSLRDRLIRTGKPDHGISTATVLDEIRDLCAKGGTLA